MAYLAVIASAHVNGVAQIHSGKRAWLHAAGQWPWHACLAVACGWCCRQSRSLPNARPPCCPCTTDILKHDVFGPFYDIFPEKFQNKTNGCVLVGAWLLSICVQPAC